MRSSPFALLDGLIVPPPAPERVAFLHARPFAHRGLHRPGIVENSRAAFAAAVAAGHGIECDVQLSRDGEAFVFHDAELDRLTGGQGRCDAQTGAALARIALGGTSECLPRLREVLALVAGRVPILIELKAPGRRVGPLCRAVRRDLEGYRGHFALMSFNPDVGRWLARHAPRIVRGLIVSEAGRRGLRGRVDRHLALWRARPDFLAYDIRDLPSPFAATARRRGVPVLTWTVRGDDAAGAAHAWADQIIYEQAG
ncbi:MAG: glycerophosphoryl diester phosphodiesterase [Sphingomonas bacterium]|jgi:glycerophosphoryl diester phosphodiesterase|nr:glycerophosphoryl diester phosphodiesterase [Sphingomonas bacterium]